MSEYTSDKVSTMLATDANSSLEILTSHQKSKTLSSQAASEFLSVAPQDRIERELMRQLDDPQTTKLNQLKQLKRLTKRCEDFNKEKLDNML
jgi:hypothetical protein